MLSLLAIVEMLPVEEKMEMRVSAVASPFWSIMASQPLGCACVSAMTEKVLKSDTSFFVFAINMKHAENLLLQLSRPPVNLLAY